MFGKNKKLTNLSKEDLAELIKRSELINQNLLIAQALELQKRIWLQECFKRLGLNPELRYQIDFKDGAVTEAKKDEPVGNKENLK